MNTLDEARVKRTAQAKRTFAGAQLVFGLVFTLLSLLFGIITVIQPALKTRASSQWVQTPCVITVSRWETSPGSSSKPGSRPYYSLSIAYEYQFKNRPYRSATYSFFSLGSNEATSPVAARLPVGTTTVCWVNPSNPAEAVLNRDMQLPALFVLISLGLLAAGLAVSFNAWKSLSA